MIFLSPVVIGESRRGTFLEFLGKEQTFRQCVHSFLGYQYVQFTVIYVVEKSMILTIFFTIDSDILGILFYGP